MRETISDAVAQLGDGELSEQGIAQHLRPLFSETLARGGIYLAGHTLGRPLDRMQVDVAEGAKLWTETLRDSWGPWLAEEQAYRAAIAGLLGLAQPDCVVPRVSAGHALRSVLNTLPIGSTVLTTREEFASVAVVLAQYASLHRLRVVFAGADGSAMAAALEREPAVTLVVVSQVFYADGRVLAGMETLAAACRARGVRLLLDCYHALGAMPVGMGASTSQGGNAIDCDYMIGGCYKYLRGGPGAAFLAIAPRVFAQGTRPLDTGWFAQESGADPWQAEGPALRPGGDAWLEGTPPVMTYYQARSGLEFVRAVGVERLRHYSLGQLRFLREQLAGQGIESTGGDSGHGAFLTVPWIDAPRAVAALAEQGIVIDAREGRLRLCPDVLTSRDELLSTVSALGVLLKA